jgi:hypothetical protein
LILSPIALKVSLVLKKTIQAVKFLLLNLIYL